MSWRDLEDEMSDVQSAEYAEPVVIIPMRHRTNERPCEDPERPAFETIGIFEWLSSNLELLKGRDKSAAPPAAFHATRAPTINFDKRDLKGVTLVQGDLVVLTERGDLTFEISTPKPDGQGRIHCTLNQRGSHAP